MLERDHKITFQSATDTEVVAVLIGTFLDTGASLSDAIEKAAEILEGAYSFVLISILEPQSMYIFKNTGTMVIGVSAGLQAASDHKIHHLAEEE